MKKSLRYIFTGALLWVLLLSVNWVSYAISDDASKLREGIFLSFDQADVPTSGFEANDVKLVSLNQRNVNESKKQEFTFDHFNLRIAGQYFELNLKSYLYSTRDKLYQSLPFDLLTHQFLI